MLIFNCSELTKPCFDFGTKPDRFGKYTEGQQNVRHHMESLLVSLPSKWASPGSWGFLASFPWNGESFWNSSFLPSVERAAHRLDLHTTSSCYCRSALTTKKGTSPPTPKKRESSPCNLWCVTKWEQESMHAIYRAFCSSRVKPGPAAQLPAASAFSLGN